MLEVYYQRRACRKFDSSREVEEEKIKKIIDAGLQAPSGRGTQNVIIIATSDKKTRDRLAKINAEVIGANNDTFYGAPVILLVASKKGPFAHFDGAAVIENLLLAATELGLGSCWIHRAKEELESEEGKDILSFTGLDLDEYEGIGHAVIGYSLMEEYPPKPIKPNRVYWSK